MQAISQGDEPAEPVGEDRGPPVANTGIPPLIPITLALLAGQMLIGWRLALPPALLLGLGGISLATAVWPRRRLPALLLVAFAWGNWSAARVADPVLPRGHIAHWCDGSAPLVEARLLRDPEAGSTRSRLLLEAERVEAAGGPERVTGRILLTVRSLHHDWRAGDRLRARLRLRRPRNFGNPGEFDYEGYLARQGIYVTGFLLDDERIERIERPLRSPWLSAWRRGIGEVIDAHLGGDEGAMLRALIIGDTAAIAPELRRQFAVAGVSHVLSISGLHVGLVATLAYLFWRWLLGRSRWLLLRANVPKLAGALSVVPVALYAGIAGSNTATIRSVIMVLVFLGAVLVDRRGDPLVSLAVAALAISLLWPGALLDISFQLSFVAVLFLVLAMERFWPWWAEWEERHLVRLRGGVMRHARPAAAYAAVSAAAFLGTAPLTAFHFNQISWVALLANALVVPVLGTVTVSLGLTAALLYPLSALLAGVLVDAAWPSLWLGRQLVRFFATFPHAALRVVTPSVTELAIAYALLLCLLCGAGRRRLCTVGLLALLALLDAGGWYCDRFHRPDLRVTFLSVGQGDSAVVECPGSAVMVIDGGGLGDGSFDVGERLIAPFLWGRKIGRIDTVVMSHPQWDHYGGLAYLVRQFRPREFWSTGDVAHDSVRFSDLENALDAAGVRRVTLGPGMIRRCGDAVVRALGPTKRSESINDRSLVLQVERSGGRVLFTGDIEREGEAALLGTTDGRLRSTVLKVPHHGSATSSTAAFVAAVHPVWAVASVGFENRFGFPQAKTLATYAEAGVRLHRTDRDGAVRLTIHRGGSATVQVTRQGRAGDFP